MLGLWPWRPQKAGQAGSLLPIPPQGAMSEGVEVPVLRDQVGRGRREEEINVSTLSV